MQKNIFRMILVVGFLLVSVGCATNGGYKKVAAYDHFNSTVTIFTREDCGTVTDFYIVGLWLYYRCEDDFDYTRLEMLFKVTPDDIFFSYNPEYIPVFTL